MTALREAIASDWRALVGPRVASRSTVSIAAGGHLTVRVDPTLAAEVTAWTPALRIKAAGRGIALKSLTVLPGR